MFKGKLFDVKQPLLKISITLLYIAYALLFYIFKLKCPWKFFVNIPCMGCGLTTAYVALFQLNFISAFQAHFMFWGIPILYGYIWFDGKLFSSKKWNTSVLCVILGGFLLRWILVLLNY